MQFNTASNDAQQAHGGTMRMTVTIDGGIMLIAQQYTGLTRKSALVQEALKALIDREYSRRLAAPGGTMPELKDIPRREVP
jgi:Arc/MetJ family transcription regulator